MLPIDRGMQPVKLLLDNTIYLATDSPIVSGMLPLNQLWFRKIISSPVWKSSGGNSPSKLLNLRSRYKFLIQVRVTVGKEPTSLLLLTSNSSRRSILEKVSGMIPQSLFVFAWKYMRSTNHPISGGKCAAISALFRSIIATNLSWLSVNTSHKTPLYSHTSVPTQLSV